MREPFTGTLPLPELGREGALPCSVAAPWCLSAASAQGEIGQRYPYTWRWRDHRQWPGANCSSRANAAWALAGDLLDRSRRASLWSACCTMLRMRVFSSCDSERLPITSGRISATAIGASAHDCEDYVGAERGQLMHQACRRCLQFYYGAPDPLPNEAPLAVAPVEHFSGASRRGDLGSVAMFPDQQTGGPPYIGIGNHKRPPFLGRGF